MREMMLAYAAIIFLVSEAWSLNQAFSGTNQSTPVKPNSTSSSPDFVVRYSSFRLGSDANLTCGNRTWTKMMFIIWNLHLKSKPSPCRITFNSDGQNQNSCNDGKSLRNTSEAQSFLYVPKFSYDDVGVYECESVFSGGVEAYSINVSITVPPRLSAWLEWKGDKVVAVCKAERGIPAANISWSLTGNSSSLETTDSDGSLTVESRLELPMDVDRANVSCAISHLFWEYEQSLPLKLEKGPAFTWVHLAIPISIAFFLGFLFFGHKKLIKLRRCQKSSPSPLKSPPTEDVEEVEPYASYVQRVNSIYNSSLDVFT